MSETPLVINRDAEEATLGAILLSPRVLDVLGAEEGLAPEHFYYESHRRLYREMLALHDRGEPVDELTLVSRLDDLNHLIYSLTGPVPAAGNVRRYAQLVIECAVWRERVGAAGQIVVAAQARDEMAYQDAERRLLERADRPDDRTSSPDQLADDFAAFLNSGGAECFKWPFARLDYKTSGGAKRGEVTLIGGWSSHGKSAFLDQALRNFCAQGLSAHLWINEMTKRMRVARHLAGVTGSSVGDLAQGHPDPRYLKAITDELGRLPYPITDMAGWTIEQWARSVRRQRPDIAALDILHLISHRDERDLAHISQVLNETAKVCDCHVIATVHLNESRVMGQVRPIPTNGDIRGSGMLKNDADNVLFIFREQDADTGNPEDAGSIYFSKVRMGEPGGVPVTFNGRHTMFYETESWRSAA